MEPEKTPRERASEFIEDLVAPAWQPSRDQVLWVIRIVLVLAVLLAILTLIGLPFGITLWAWVKLLIVPVVLAIGGFLFTRSENRSTQAAAERRAQDEALQAYLDQVGQLLLDKDAPLRQSEENNEQSEEDSAGRTLARARTLTVLSRLDSDHKAQVVQFVYEAGLIARGNRVLDLSGADLSRANLSRASLSEADLSGPMPELPEGDPTGPDLRGADLSGADLYDADLSHADLRGAVLYEANLVSGTYLVGANLRGADLRRADLGSAELYDADLSYADLRGAILRGADLSKASVYEEQLTRAKSFEGATMPDGQTLKGDKTPNGPTLEDWLKDKKAHEKDGENE